MDTHLGGPPEPKGGDLPLGSQPVDSTNLLDQNDSSYNKIFHAAETFERLAEIRLDTTNATRGGETSKKMANLWGSLNQDERSAVFVSLLSRHLSHGEWSGFPAPNLICEMDGKITGLSFDAGKLDFRPGPKSLQIADGDNGSVDVKTRTGDWFSNKQADLVTDYHQDATAEFAKESEFDRAPKIDYDAIRKAAENIEFIAKNRLDTTDLREAEEISKELTEVWSSLDQEEREAVSVTLLTRSQTEGFDRLPDATVIKDTDGYITGLNFEAGSMDFYPGPSQIQVADRPDGMVEARSKDGNWFAKNDYKTDYIRPAETLKVVGSNKAPAQPGFWDPETDSSKDHH